MVFNFFCSKSFVLVFPAGIQTKLERGLRCGAVAGAWVAGANRVKWKRMISLLRIDYRSLLHIALARREHWVQSGWQGV